MREIMKNKRTKSPLAGKAFFALGCCPINKCYRVLHYVVNVVKRLANRTSSKFRVPTTAGKALV